MPSLPRATRRAPSGVAAALPSNGLRATRRQVRPVVVVRQIAPAVSRHATAGRDVRWRRPSGAPARAAGCGPRRQLRPPFALQ